MSESFLIGDCDFEHDDDTTLYLVCQSTLAGHIALNRSYVPFFTLSIPSLMQLALFHYSINAYERLFRAFDQSIAVPLAVTLCLMIPLIASACIIQLSQQCKERTCAVVEIPKELAIGRIACADKVLSADDIAEYARLVAQYRENSTVMSALRSTAREFRETISASTHQ